ncbi:valine--tRNA ligase [Alphaproteobacteria bacterium]|jgi:valyl-tRNA synthetase|nr:valine--tRNA ligase [Alphaproteobacteria bacterium]MDB2583789.1 valine--tRNA ligase [Alphaproteobacteria bacterium]
MMDKRFDAKSIELKWYEKWLKSGAFASNSSSSKKPYVIMMPPPNVTGSLHIGHALTFTIQDILIRFHRMQGFDVLWQPGTDHAGIATQMVVERELAKSKITRHDLGRDKFIEKVWEWKDQSGGTITNQLRALGASPDWEKERFTMDDGLSKAVNYVFVKLYKEGLVYRDKRLVNWDPKLLTAISDLEVEQRETNGKFWFFNYPIQGSDEFLTIATTRPETMLGDTAVAVNPNDERYKHLKGKNVLLPIINRIIPIIFDDYSDPTKGTGAVKITPAHDFNDFEVGKRHGLQVINILNADATINENGTEEFQGLDRFEARHKIIEKLKSLNLFVKEENITHTVPHGDRSNVIVEPWLMDQWYVDAKKLALPAIKAVEEGNTTFIPQSWDKTYYEWMRNIQPWCVSRQLWWGHRIPAWFGPDNKVFVESNEQAALDAAEIFYGKKVELIQDEDVLDTWFSSALWPFSTLGWPEKTKDLRKYYPTSVLVTGFDIIFFWVARMMMMGIHFMDKEVPFKEVYIHALVRDEKGQKMSKSKGNVLDPLDLSSKYGADALRFTLTAMAAQGRDIKLSEERIAGYRNFSTKIWNGCKFLEFNDCISYIDKDIKKIDLEVNKWIVKLYNDLNNRVKTAIKEYKFNDAADALYQFIWKDYCDWYIEFIKPILNNTDNLKDFEETKHVSINIMKNVLLMLHPIMPYVTEEILENLFKSSKFAISSTWPEPIFNKLSLNNSIDLVIKIISSIRSLRVEKNIPPNSKIDVIFKNVNKDKKDIIESNINLITNLAKLNDLTFVSEDITQTENFIISTVDEIVLMIPLQGLIDTESEKNRLNKELSNINNEIDQISKRLNNQMFIDKAPSKVVQEVKNKQEIFYQRKSEIEKALNNL